MKNTFARFFNIALFVLVAVGMVASMVTPVAAAPASQTLSPDCRFSPVNITVEIGEVINFHMVNPNNQTSYMWDWGNGTAVSTDANTQNSWNALGDVLMFVVASNRSSMTRCNSWVHVVASTGSAYDGGYGGGFNTPDPTAVSTPASATSGTTEVHSEGDYSSAIVGNGNTVNITINPAVVVTPEVVIVTPIVITPVPTTAPVVTATPSPTLVITGSECSYPSATMLVCKASPTTAPVTNTSTSTSGSSSVSSPNVNVQVGTAAPTTQKVDWWWTPLHALLKGNEAFFKYLDEGWFMPVLVK